MHTQLLAWSAWVMSIIFASDVLNNNSYSTSNIVEVISKTALTMTGYKAEDESISDYIQFLVKTHAILKYYSIMVVIFGSGFNLINFACFYQMKKRSSQNIYLIFLSLADLFNIQINITIPLIRNALSKKNLVDFDFFVNESESGGTNLTSTPSDPNPWAEFFCILDGYLVEVGLLLPAWIMVVLAAERFLIIAWPLRKNVSYFILEINFFDYLK